MSAPTQLQRIEPSTLLYNDECSVCRRVAGWVRASQRSSASRAALHIVPIGDDPLALRDLHSDLDIWDAYATIHLLTPEGGIKVGGEAVAEVLRLLPGTRWFAWLFGVSIFGSRPFQSALNAAYAILSAVRPLFGCESCGMSSLWLRPLVALTERIRGMFRRKRHPHRIAHFASLSPRMHRVTSLGSG